MFTLKNILIERISSEDQNYTKISNQMIKDKSLTPQAKGVLIYLFTLTNNSNITIPYLADELNTTTGIIKRSLEELENSGYIHLNTDIKNKPQHVILQFTAEDT